MDEGKTSPMPDAGQNLFRPDESDESSHVAESAVQSPSVTDSAAREKPATSESGVITWTASEFIAHQKSARWYVLLALAAIAIAVMVYLLTRDFFPTLAVTFGVLLLAVYAGRQPSEESYRIDQTGVTIGIRRYNFHDFRSFAVVPDGAFSSIELTPLRRFAMYANLYFDPSDEDRIIDQLSQHLPMEEPHRSLTDNLMRRIHF